MHLVFHHFMILYVGLTTGGLQHINLSSSYKIRVKALNWCSIYFCRNLGIIDNRPRFFEIKQSDYGIVGSAAD